MKKSEHNKSVGALSHVLRIQRIDPIFGAAEDSDPTNNASK